MTRPGVPDLGRFSDPALLILISLADGPKHGYAIMTDIETLSGVKLGPGTLYGAITRLEKVGWIEALPETDRRHPYRITIDGTRVLKQQLAGLRTLVRVGMERLPT